MKRKPRSTFGERRELLITFVALGLVVYFAVTGFPLGPYWTGLLGAMLGLGVLTSATKNGKGDT